MRHPELPVVSFLSIPLLLCSLPSHIRAGSAAIISLIAWLAVVSLIRGVNALVWADNVNVRLEVWCDITTKITVGFTYAIPASTLCILRHLESVASTRTVRSTRIDKRRRQMFEVAMCFGLPLIGMALRMHHIYYAIRLLTPDKDYIVQGHRLDLIEDFGCYPPVYFSVAAILILWVPPFAMSLTTFGYAALTLRHFLRRRIEFATHLQHSQSAISPARYVRLMALAIVEMVWDSGVNAYLIYFNSFTGLRPWTSWDDVHSNFSRVAIFPEALIPPIFVTQLIWQWWIVPISCILFFIFFGFGEEAMADYRMAVMWLRRTILLQRPHGVGDDRLPSYQLRRPYIVTSFNPPDFSPQIDSKGWNDSPIKIPETIYSAQDPFVPDETLYGGPPLTKDSNSHLDPALLDDLGEIRVTSSDTMRSSVMSAHVTEHSSSPLTPAFNTNYQGGDMLPHNVDIHTSSLPGPSPPIDSHHADVVDSTLRRTSFRHSVSTDMGITVSPAYRQT